MEKATGANIERGLKLLNQALKTEQTGQLALLGTDYAAPLERLDACVPPFGSAS